MVGGRVQVVNDQRLVPSRDQLVDDMRTDEAGAAGDQNSHLVVSNA